VTDAEGRTLCTASAGEQKHFTATTSTITLSDPAAALTATFNRAASALGLLGGGVKTPAWVKSLEAALAPQMSSAYKVEYKSGTLLVHSDYEQQEGLADVVSAAAAEYAPEGTPLAQKWMPPEGTKIGQYQAVWQDRECDISAYAPLPVFTGTAATSFFRYGKMKTLPEWVFETVTTGNYVFAQSSIELLPKKYMFPNLTQSASSSRGLLADCANLAEIPEAWTFEKLELAINFASECKQLKKAHGLNLKSLKNANGFMNQAQVDKRTALRVLQTVPAWQDGERHLLTLGIHVDHQTDEDVVNAIAEAEAKGWTLSVQWNGKATAAAASTWGRRKPVFARLGEPLEDGTPVLDWGHYVTEPSGYMEFASLEEAKEHFNIKDDNNDK
jgi:hypothetical protein